MALAGFSGRLITGSAGDPEAVSQVSWKGKSWPHGIPKLHQEFLVIEDIPGWCRRACHRGLYFIFSMASALLLQGYPGKLWGWLSSGSSHSSCSRHNSLSYVPAAQVYVMASLEMANLYRWSMD